MKNNLSLYFYLALDEFFVFWQDNVEGLLSSDDALPRMAMKMVSRGYHSHNADLTHHLEIKKKITVIQATIDVTEDGEYNSHCKAGIMPERIHGLY